MTDVTTPEQLAKAKRAANLAKRYRSERRFRAFGMAAVLTAMGILGF